MFHVTISKPEIYINVNITLFRFNTSFIFQADIDSFSSLSKLLSWSPRAHLHVEGMLWFMSLT